MEEIWKDITVEYKGVLYDLTGLYQVSNYGRVKSLDRLDSNGHKLKEKILKIKPDKKGYKQAVLHKNGNRIVVSVHRLVAMAFIDNPNNYPVVNHKDENPSNNHVDNLEWCTISYNTQYSRYKYTCNNRVYSTGGNHARAKKVLCVETGQVFDCIKDANLWCKGDVGACVKGRRKTAGGYHWEYVGD